MASKREKSRVNCNMRPIVNTGSEYIKGSERVVSEAKDDIVVVELCKYQRGQVVSRTFFNVKRYVIVPIMHKDGVEQQITLYN